MAYGRFRRYRRIGWRRRRGIFGRRRYRRGYARRYVNATSRSTIRMKCTQTYSSTKTSGHGADLGNVTAVTPYLVANTMGVVNNPLYQAYCNLYEETKLIGMKVNVNVTSVVGNATLPSLQIYTAWDRRFGYGEALPTANAIRSAATTNIATALNNNVAKITRSLYASDLMEKAQWHDSSYDATGDLAWMQAGVNPNFFCPAFLLAFGSPTLAADTNVNYTISVIYYVAFRNPKYGGSGSAKDLPTKQVEFLDDEGDLDDGDMDIEQADIDAAAAMSANRAVRGTVSKTRARDILADPGPLAAGDKRYPKN